MRPLSKRKTWPWICPAKPAPSRGAFLKQLERIENRLHHTVFAERGVDHEVEEVTCRPLELEVLLDIGRAIAIHGLGQLHRLRLGLAGFAQAAHLLFERSIDEDMKHIGPPM